MTQPVPVRRSWRKWKVLAVTLIVSLIVIVTAIPWLLTTGPGRSRIAASLNRALAPGRLQFEGLHLSWFKPARLTNVTLLDPTGQTVANIPEATYDQNLLRMIVGVKGPTTLTLDRAQLEVERAEDGSVNLVKALRTIIDSRDPLRDLTIRINHGQLRYRDPVLAETTIADALDLTLQISPAPSPVTWNLKLGQGDASLVVRGDCDRWLAHSGDSSLPDLQMNVVGKRWPFSAKAGGIDAKGRFEGTLDFTRKHGSWVFSGDSLLLGLNAQGKPLAGDSLALDRVVAGYDIVQSPEGWTVRRLSVTSPLGEVKAEGQLNGPKANVNATGRQRIEGRIDLAAIARQLPHAFRLREGLTIDRGSARVAIDLTSQPDQSIYEVEARLSDLAARDHDRPVTLREPATLNGRLVRKGKDTNVERLVLKTSFLDLSVQGKLAESVKMTGSLDLDQLRKQVGDWVDLGQLRLSGRAEITGNYQFESVAALKLDPTKIAGVRAIDGGGPRYDTSIDARFRDLQVDNPGLPSFRQQEADTSFHATSIGLADDSGWPLSWEYSQVTLSSGRMGASLSIASTYQSNHQASKSVASKLSIRIKAGTTLMLADNRQRPINSSWQGTWSSDTRRLSLDNVMIRMTPSNLNRPGDLVELDAKGHLDFATGEFFLEPSAIGTHQSIFLDPEGLRITCLSQGWTNLQVDGGLSGKVENIDGLIADLAGGSPKGLGGRWSAKAQARGEADGLRMMGKLAVLEETDSTSKPGRPTSLAVSAFYSPRNNQVDFSEFTMSTAYGTIDASGKVFDPAGVRQVDLNGRLAPDFAAINAILAAKIEPGARIDGKPSVFHASGKLNDPSLGWKGLDANLGFELSAADIYGMKFGPSSVVLRSKGGQLRFDPISTTLNEGHVRLEPELDLEANGGPVLRLAKNSNIRDARINDEVSQRVLAFVAPVLDKTTRASGLVSIDLDHAEFPIGPGRGRQAKVEGAVLFQDVEFAPGPLAGVILGAIGRQDLTLKLDQPVTLTIADGRVNQRGMTIPVGDLTRIELSGWVDFDKNLSLIATVPVTSAMLGNNPLLSDIASGTKVRLPITGSLDRPSIDQKAFKANLQEMGESLLTRGATRGAMELLMRLGRPKDPNAPPPPPRLTPEERKEIRQEKRAIRRGEIPQPQPQPQPQPSPLPTSPPDPR